MIFNNDLTTDLLLQYQKETDKARQTALMNQILKESKGLVEAIVGKDYTDDRIQFDDMVQKILIHLMFKLPRFHPDRGSLHNYASTLIRNKAIDELRKVQRSVPTLSFDDEIVALEPVGIDQADPITTRWQMLALWLYYRFTTLTKEEAIDISGIVINGLINEKSKKDILDMIREQVDLEELTRSKLSLIYQSCIWFVRAMDIDQAGEHLVAQDDPLWTLYPELVHSLGEPTARQLRILFAGMSILFRN